MLSKYNLKFQQKKLSVFIVLSSLIVIGGSMSFIKDAMRFLSKGDVVLFSALQGVVTDNGVKVSGAKITRRVEDKEGKGEDESAITNDDGYFSMPTRYGRSSSPIQEIYAWQTIFVEYKGKNIQVWHMTKNSKEENGELDGTPIYLLCELTNQERVWETKYFSRISTICDLKGFDGVNILQNNE